MSRPRFRHTAPTDMIARRGATTHRVGLDASRRLSNVEAALQSSIGVDTDELNLYRALGSTLLTYNFDPATCANATDNSAQLASGLSLLQAVYLPVPATVTGVATYAWANSSGTWTIGRSAIYSASGTRLAYTGNDTSAWKTAGLYQQPLTTGQTDFDRGLYYIGIINVRSATTVIPTVASRNYPTAVLGNVLTPSSLPRAVYFSDTDLSASYTLSSGTLSLAHRWVALY